jgi:hypothetical protein
MDNRSQTRTSWLRFTMRAMLVFVFVIAMLLWSGREIYDRYHSVSLADLVATFNEHSKANTEVGPYEPPLTTDELVSAINKKIPLLDASPAINATFAKIAKSQRAPEGSKLDSIELYTDEKGQHAVWWIRFIIQSSDRVGYALAIRDNNNPAILTIHPTHSISNVDILEVRERYQNGQHKLN